MILLNFRNQKLIILQNLFRVLGELYVLDFVGVLSINLNNCMKWLFLIQVVLLDLV